MAPVYRALKNIESFEVSLVSTGQHRQMSRQALEAFELAPDVELDLMTDGQSLGQFASRSLEALNDLFAKSKPDVILVQGDTTTTLMASLAAFYNRILIGHVEAGMRTGDLYSPWPEEMNRRLTADLANWHFVPVERNADNLIREGISAEKCYVTGNTVLDSLVWTRDRLNSRPTDQADLQKRLQVTSSFFETYFVQRQRFLLVTCHRRESQGQGLREVCEAIRRLCIKFPGLGIYFPVHPNPAVSRIVDQELNGVMGVSLAPPLDYNDFVWVMDRCHFILSDSGGIQGEGMTLNKPVLVTRNTTEYPEAVDCGGCQLVGTDPGTICHIATELLTNQAEYERRSNVVNPYGNGKASQSIAQILEEIVAQFES